jgi:RimJ/RimL family protein N-acetyltransferase
MSQAYPQVLHTERLILRPWRKEDYAPFAAQSADPKVMEFFPKCLDEAETQVLTERIQAHFHDYGYGWWAVEVKNGPPFIGYVGLENSNFDAPFTPAVEIGWRLGADYWDEGYAHEAAEAALAFGFEQVGLEEIVAFTVPENERSRGLMTRLGRQYDPADDFEHPGLPEGHPLRHHVLYRLSRHQWISKLETGDNVNAC